jgi:hypothetical protein
MSKTHRCPDCPPAVHHDDGLETKWLVTHDGRQIDQTRRVGKSELCPSCGRCSDHCHEDTHDHMSEVAFDA